MVRILKNVIELLEYIQKIMPQNAQILVRTNGKEQWLINYFLKIDETGRKYIYKTYSNNLAAELLKVIDIIKKEDDENK